MVERKELIEAARKVLTGPSMLAREDTFLLDHALRVLRYMDAILEFEEVRSLRVDRICLDGAALFHDAAWVRLERERRESPAYSAATMSADEIRDYSAEMAAEELKGLLDNRQIGQLQEIIRNYQSRTTRLAEAMVLSDACNLDDLGAIGVWRELRRFALEGRGIEDALTSWRRKIDYGYFAARINDTFRFAESRKWAEARLKRLEHFMAEMRRENEAQDPRTA